VEDIRYIFKQASVASAAHITAAPALVNALAEAIIDLPHGAAVTECSFFADAFALAKPRIERIAQLNQKAKYWAGCKFGV
jgi:hypothetical protein